MLALVVAAVLLGIACSGGSESARLASNTSGVEPPRAVSRDAGGRKHPAAGGYVRIFPLFDGYPGLPGRFDPRTNVVCMVLDEPVRVGSCPRVQGELREVLGAARRLGRVHRLPTVVVTLRYAGGRVRFGNLNVAIELALLRGEGRAGRQPRDCFPFSARWRGAEAESRPRRVSLCRHSIRADGRSYPLATSRLWQWAHLNLRGQAAQLEGTSGADVLRGTAGPDGLRGLAGDDRLLGFAGRDGLHGKDGDDRLYGHAGNDRAFAGRGRDLVYAGEGKDWADDDVLFGGPGDDHLSGRPGADRLFGNAGDDFIDTRDPNRTLRGLAECRDCEPIPAADELVSGDAGDDRILARDGRRDVIACGSGLDVVIADRGDRFSSRYEPAACEVVLARFDRRGISFSYPENWFATARPLSNGRDPDYRFAVATWPVDRTARDRGPCLASIAAQRPAGGALAFLRESIGVSRKHALPRLRTRPRHFRLPTQRDGSFFCLGSGSLSYSFKDSGRAFILGIVIGPRASVATRRKLSRLLDGMEIRPLPR